MKMKYTDMLIAGFVMLAGVLYFGYRGADAESSSVLADGKEKLYLEKSSTALPVKTLSDQAERQTESTTESIPDNNHISADKDENIIHSAHAPRRDRDEILKHVSNRRGYHEVLNDVRAEEGELSKERLQSYTAFLKSRHNSQSQLTLMEYNAVKNDLLDKMIDQIPVPPNLGFDMIEMYRDETMDLVWRDYCIQHFPRYVRTKWGEGKLPDNGETRAIHSVLWEAVDNEQSTIAGSALIALEEMTHIDSGYDKALVASKALSIAGDPNAPLSARVTALQVCGIMHENRAVSIAREIANSNSHNISLKMSAIAAVGSLGGSTDLTLLDSIIDSSSQYYIKNSARSARKRLLTRIENEDG